MFVKPNLDRMLIPIVCLYTVMVLDDTKHLYLPNSTYNKCSLNLYIVCAYRKEGVLGYTKLLPL